MIGEGIRRLALVVGGLVAFAEPIKLYVTSAYLDMLDIVYIGLAVAFEALTWGWGESLRPALYGLPIVYVVGSLVAGGFLVYLVMALFKPDAFS
jgi:hypothetical protein